MIPCRTVLPSEVNDLKEALAPGIGREKFFQVCFGLSDLLAARKTPTRGQPVNMRVDRKGRLAECLCHHDAGAFVADAGQLFKLLDVARNLAAVLIENGLGHLLQSPRLARSKATASNQHQDFVLRHLRERGWRRCTTKERWRDAIDLGVGGLR